MSPGGARSQFCWVRVQSRLISLKGNRESSIQRWFSKNIALALVALLLPVIHRRAIAAGVARRTLRA